jgi:hypothetical protein
MSLQAIDKSNLYFSAQLLVNHLLTNIVDGHIANNQIQYHLFELKQVFRNSIASTTTHLEAIADLVKSYMVFHNEQDIDNGVPFVTAFLINRENNMATLHFNSSTVELIKTRDFHIKAAD